MPSDSQAKAYQAVAPPSLRLLMLECRAPFERGSFPLLRRAMRGLPEGDGHAVIVVPGFGASDRATRALRTALASLGYRVYGWGLGRNLGMRPGMKEALASQLAALHEAYGPVSLIGWSLGGVYVREMARHAPQRVRRVFTLGSPIRHDPDANNLVPLFRLANRGLPLKIDMAGFKKREAPPPVPCVAIYTRSDGIVNWLCTLEPVQANTENVEVGGSHMGLIANRQVFKELALRLIPSP